jgi:hypothetical protein
VSTSRAFVWLLRAGWLALAVAVGPVIGGALDGRSGPVVAVAAAGSWVAWGAGLVALLVPATTSLTALRSLAPAVPIAALVAVAAGGTGTTWRDGTGIVVGMVVALVAFAPPVGRAFVQGSAYGDEVRFPLRAPGALLLGPLELLWALTVGLAPLGALLVAAKVWVGVLPLVAGVATAVVGGQRLHRLSRRWLVFVPAGVVLHDHVALAEPVMARKATVVALRPAPAGTDATDCTARALGLALELRLDAPAPVLLAGDLQHRTGRPVVTPAVLCTPSQPGAVLEEARRRGLPTA